MSLRDLRERLAVVLVPRERLTPTAAAAERLIDGPGRLIVVADRRAPPSARVCARADVVWADGYLLPWQAKELACARLKDEDFVAFVDNDVELGDGALASLVRALEETGAGLAHPLVLHRTAGRTRIHVARGLFVDEGGALAPHMEHLSSAADADVGARRFDDYAELHTVVVARRALDRLRPFAPVAIAEEIHVSLLLRDAGERIVFEPAARVTYVATPALSSLDRSFFRFRWDESRIDASIALLERSTPIAQSYWQAKRRWLPRHRRLSTLWYAAADRLVTAARSLAHAIRPEQPRSPR